MIKRQIEKKIIGLAKKFPIISITGPRQAGKTTLLKHIFKNMPYVSFEDPDTRLLAMDDPRAFLHRYSDGAILDEVQHVPELFSYLQTKVDESGKEGQYILSGSQSFLLHQNISQTLAGRTAILKLLPLSLEELKTTGQSDKNLEKLLFTGGYPRIYDKQINPLDFFPSYIQTYIERDVRSLQNIQNLTAFARFLKLCAGRVGQLLNMSALASDSGLSVNTVKSWLSVLEASYIIFLLQPHFTNFNKRLVKMPKLYFFDTGLVCNLLGLEHAEQLISFHMRGELFENFVLSELFKHRYNQGRQPNIYFWRDNKGLEIDCIIEKAEKLIPVEIKSGLTPTIDYFRNLKHWNRISDSDTKNNIVLYAGDISQNMSLGKLVSWQELSALIEKLQ